MKESQRGSRECLVSKLTPIQEERPIDLTTRYRDRSRTCNEAASDWRAESRTNGRNFGGRRVTASYGGAKITGCLATRPFNVIDIYIPTPKGVPSCGVFWTK